MTPPSASLFLYLQLVLTMFTRSSQTKEHAPLAHAIDAFYSVFSGDWLDADEELFRGALPPVVEPVREVRALPRRVGVAPAAAAPHTGSGRFVCCGGASPSNANCIVWRARGGRERV